MKRLNIVHPLDWCTIIGALLLSFQTTLRADDVKIGFVVKQPEEPWFQDEWRFAEQAAKEKNFTVVKIGAENGEKVMSAIDNLASQQAQGFIICVPDVKLGPAVVGKANADHLKLMTVDDQLVDGKGKPHINSAAYGHFCPRNWQTSWTGDRRRDQKTGLEYARGWRYSSHL